MDGSRPQSPEPPTLLYTVKQLELATRARMDRVLRPFGVTVLQYTALTVLERRQTMTAADLARASFVSAQSTQDLVEALERRALIARETDPEHRRRLLISLTPNGRELLEVVTPRVREIEDRMLTGLDDGERERFRELLLGCRKALADDTPT